MSDIRFQLIQKIARLLREAMIAKDPTKYDSAINDLRLCQFTKEENYVLDEMLDVFKEEGINWTPNKIKLLEVKDTMYNNLDKLYVYNSAEEIKKFGSFLVMEWCLELGCTNSEVLCRVKANTCHCGVIPEHIHCKNCGGLIVK